ncbi:MAG TPA: PGPGW domain-containing protein [Phycisphaerae bacterium]|jgi:uncharacterized protein (TIGR02611 family)|nr:PGPGW domain-containing protein [Phycisphaerae bacterium]HRT42569.1 PGPGW domain-containing protein [Phycisphaerae bacterium]
MLVKTVRKIVIAIVGGTVLLFGVIMLVTPGPGLVGIVAGLAILGTEFVFARQLLKKAKAGARAVGARAGVCQANSVQEQAGRPEAAHKPAP